MRSPTVTTRPPGTLQASTSRARPSPRLRRRETGPVASSPAATASSIADASSGGASRTSRSRASLRIRLPDGVRPAAGCAMGPSAAPSASTRASAASWSSAARVARAATAWARRRVPPRPATGTGVSRPAAVASAAAATALRREAARRAKSHARHGADQRERPDQRPQRPEALAHRRRAGRQRLPQHDPRPGGQLADRLDGAVAQRPPADAGRRQRRRPRGVPGRPDRARSAGLQPHPSGGAQQAGRDARALERRAGRRDARRVDRGRQVVGRPGQRIARAGGLAAHVQADGERGHQAQHQRQTNEDGEGRAPGLACAAVGVHARQGFAPRGRKSFPVPSDWPGGEIGGVEDMRKTDAR